MRLGSKLSIALTAVFLAIGPAACGDGEGSDSTTAGAAAQDGPQTGQGAGGGGDAADANESDDDGSVAAEGSGSGREAPDDFVPKQHEDSGGGSAPFRVEGGDNSVQEFGSEAGSTELEAAATALHNFLDARAQEAWASACSFLAASVQESLEAFAARAREVAAKEGNTDPPVATDCAGILGTLTPRASLPELREEAAKANVRSLRIEGDRAFVIYTALKGNVIAIPVTREAGEWKVGSLAGTPIN